MSTSATEQATIRIVAALLVLAPGPVLARRGVAEHYKESYKLEGAKRYGPALRALEGIDAGERATYFYQLRLAWLRHLKGEHAAATLAYQTAAAMKPHAVEPLLGLLLPQMATRRWKDALGTARRALRLAPGTYLASTRLAWILFNLGRYTESAKAYRQVLERYPADLEVQRGLGWALLRQGKTLEACHVFAVLLRRSPSTPPLPEACASPSPKTAHNLRR
jgi:tetratricopeptide (TPR) repeat protein